MIGEVGRSAMSKVVKVYLLMNARFFKKPLKSYSERRIGHRLINTRNP